MAGKRHQPAKTSGFSDGDDLMLSSRGKRRLPRNSIRKDFQSRCNTLRNEPSSSHGGTRGNISVNISPLTSQNGRRMLINRQNTNNLQTARNSRRQIVVNVSQMFGERRRSEPARTSDGAARFGLLGGAKRAADAAPGFIAVLSIFIGLTSGGGANYQPSATPRRANATARRVLLSSECWCYKGPH